MSNARRMLAEQKRGAAGFTLVELLITISIIAIMASMILFAFYAAQEAAKEQKTKALIAKLDAIIKAKWDSYKTRRVPITIPAGTAPPAAAKMRLDALHDIMRMEMPDRWSDIVDNPVALSGVSAGAVIARPAMSQAYLRRYNAGAAPSGEFAGAECLYLIITAALAEEGDARDVFRADDVKDVDGDGIPEFVDGWGMPIKFLRWAPGFQDSDLQIVARAQASGMSLTGQSLSDVPDAYAGGMIFNTTSPTNAFDVNNFARLTGYASSSAGSGTATYTGGTGTVGGTVVITAPYPFDPRGVGINMGFTSFALYPLIYSAGPNKCYGIMADYSRGDAGDPPPLQYSTVGLNPFFVGTEKSKPTDTTNMIGVGRIDTREENFVTNGWLDNIHNHLIGTK